jgi:DNA-binding NtrC family response regulator
MRAVLEMIRKVAPAKANVLITGENGSGKGVVARALHAASDRAEKSFITINMGGLSESLFESELFGHVKGAFTDAKADRPGRFELADGGTFFSMRLGTFRLPNKRSCCAHSKPANSRDWVPRAQDGLMYG